MATREEVLAELVRKFAIRFGHTTIRDGRPCVSHNNDPLVRDAFDALGLHEPYFLPKR
jgi:hypothetical protein